MKTTITTREHAKQILGFLVFCTEDTSKEIENMVWKCAFEYDDFIGKIAPLYYKNGGTIHQVIQKIKDLKSLKNKYPNCNLEKLLIKTI